jgi:hypothetical protein
MESDDEDNTVLNKNYYRKRDSDRGAPANGFLDYNSNKYVPRDNKKGNWCSWLGKKLLGNKQRPRYLWLEKLLLTISGSFQGHL